MNAKDQPSYARLIREFASQTGVPLVLNTSLNVKGEPVACAPMDAIRCFYSSGIDALALDGIWLTID